MQQTEAYTGVDNLEVMQEAVNYNRYLLNLVRRHAPASGKILDFGAGGGQFAAPLSAQNFDVTALEPDATLQSRLRALGLKVAGGLSELGNAMFEYVYTLNVLEHIDDDISALREIHAKLTPTGRLLIYVPACPVLYTSMDAKVGHVRRYTRRSLSEHVKAAGFAIDHIGYVDSLGFFATLAFKALDNGQGSINRGALKYYDRLVFPMSRALDALMHRWLGKNLLLVARKG